MARQRTATYRRLKLEELIAKIEQIEQQSALTLHEYPHGHTVERQRLVIALAKQVRSHLVDQLEAGEREPRQADDATRLRLVAGKT